jgi:hypothetical protein
MNCICARRKNDCLVVIVSKLILRFPVVLYGIDKLWIIIQLLLTITGFGCIIQCILKNKFFGGIYNE